MAVRRAPRRGGRGWRPATFWTGNVPASPTGVPAASKVLLASFVNVGDQELTIRRLRGLLAVHSDQNAATEYQVGALGIGIFNDTAIAAGIASLPDSVTDVDDDVWFSFTHIGQQIKVATAVGIDAQGVVQYDVDSKAMRKVPAGRSVAVIVANAHAVSAFNVTFGVRFLSSITGL
jgi:hypothetical protein